MHKWRLVLSASVLALQCVGCSDGGVDADKAVGRDVRAIVQRTSAENSPVAYHSDGAWSHATPPPLASGALPAEDSQNNYLPEESVFVEQDGISASMSDKVVESADQFSKAMRRMEGDENRSVEAQDLSKHYRNALQQAVGDLGSVEGLHCGFSVCMGSVVADSVESHDAWRSRLSANSAAESYGFIEAIDRVGGKFESRFIFSTDPALKAIMVEL